MLDGFKVNKKDKFRYQRKLTAPSSIKMKGLFFINDKFN